MAIKWSWRDSREKIKSLRRTWTSWVEGQMRKIQEVERVKGRKSGLK
jgi:hypothetical protein